VKGRTKSSVPEIYFKSAPLQNQSMGFPASLKQSSLGTVVTNFEHVGAQSIKQGQIL
jgi:hypothetical protein